jgi:hypothetical protein
MANGGNGMRADGTGGGVCPNAARMRETVRALSFEEVSLSSSPVERELKAHLASCASCAAEATALDPTLVFAALAASVSPEPAVTGRRPAPPVADDARRVAEAVLDEVRRRARVTTPGPFAAAPSAWRFRRVAQAAALVGLTLGLAGLVRWERLRPSEAAVRASATPRPAVALPSEASARPLIEGMRSPNARVYEFASASPQEPAVVFVANPNADL